LFILGYNREKKELKEENEGFSLGFLEDCVLLK